LKFEIADLGFLLGSQKLEFNFQQFDAEISLAGKSQTRNQIISRLFSLKVADMIKFDAT
jgi:hypothetical protein